jgi:TonB family protein
MANDLNKFLTISLLIHASLFVVFSLHSKRAAYVVLPIELLVNSAPRGGQTAVAQPVKAPVEQVKKIKEKEIVIPKKQKEKPRQSPKAEPEKEAEQPRPAQETPPPAAPAQAPGQGFTGGIRIDSVRFPYAYYTNLVVRKIGRYWQWSNEFGKLRTVVFFRINRDGGVAEVNLKDPSGDSLFDDQAVRAVKLASPFPPLPEGYAEKDLGVYFEFTYRE